ncbi:MAG TPA: hypothetical protein PKE29_13500 [Phycisphaerales bacterium]|nr:hypothetical protein [Phycisphaerales bacterium]
MIALLRNRLAYLSASLVLLVVAFPLISIGATHGPKALWWIGLLALGCGGLIPPLQRLLLGPPPAGVDPAPEHESARTDATPTQSKEAKP